MTPCAHTHDAACGYQPAAAEVPCDKGCTDEDGDGTTDHQEGCAYQPGTEEQPCTHTHDESCGYQAASAGSPCTHVHDESCGYAEAGQDQPCVYQTEGCPECLQVQAGDADIVQEGVSVGVLEYTLRSDGTAVVTDGKVDPDTSIITIPGQIEVDGTTYTVTEVAESAFYNYSGAKGISLPDTLRVIGKDAFNIAISYVKGGATLTIPDSVVEIGERAFKFNDFSKIIIGDGLTEIPPEAFYEAGGFNENVEVVLGSQVAAIAPDAFEGVSVTKVTVKGETGRLDDVLAQAEGLQDASIVYDDPNALTSTWLQQQIDAAENNVPTTIEITGPVTIDTTVTVPAGKDITLIDDGTAHTLSSLTEEMFRVTGRLTISSTSEASRLVFNGGTTTTKEMGNIVAVVQGGELILKDAVFCGGSLAQEKSGAVYVGKNAVFTMTGGVIEDFSASDDMTGSVLVLAGGEFQMSGGVIQNNKNTGRDYTSGGVLLYTWYSDDPDAEMTMSGDAVIRNNVAQNGGGVYLIGNTDFRMTGGTITGNRASSGMGGGVCVAGAGNGSAGGVYHTKFVMEGGTISNNSCTNSGGGIYVNSNDVVLRGGRIENNKAGRLGGGVYVSVPPYVLHVYNGIVTDNKATVMGGGLWFCPTGDATLAVTNGVAVYKNEAEDAGDDFVALSGSTGTVHLTDRFLGGGAVEWYADGAVIGNAQNVTGSVDRDVPRFDSSDPGDRLTGITGGGNYALKAVVSDNTVKLAESQAKLWITGNEAPRGGGIGSNGAVQLGEPKRDHTLRVIKEWSENTPESEKKEIAVYLKIGDYELDAVSLNAENNWTAKFTQLPDPESLSGSLQYAVVEKPVPEGFTPTYQQAVIEGNTIFITLTNTYDPEPETPTRDLTVEKVWKLDDGGVAADSVTVLLRKDGNEYDRVQLNAQNQWRHTWYGLDARSAWTVEEVDVPAGFSVTVSQQGSTVTIINDDEPIPPEEPETPNTPETPDTPDVPNTPGEPGIPQTGDPADPARWGALLVASGTGLAVIGALKRKRQRGARRK